MNMKLLGAAVAAALLGLSSASFGQASGQDTPREASAAKAGPGSAESGATGASSGSATSGSTSGSATSGSAVTTDCDTLSGAAKRRCLREQGASSGSSTSAPAGSVTKAPDQSGPGTSDKTNPRNPNAPAVGTSSAGSQ